MKTMEWIANNHPILCTSYIYHLYDEAKLDNAGLHTTNLATLIMVGQAGNCINENIRLTR
jgi:hypothetical protein